VLANDPSTEAPAPSPQELEGSLGHRQIGDFEAFLFGNCDNPGQQVRRGFDVEGMIYW